MLTAMAANIRDLKVWQEAVALGAEVVRCARQGARRETKVITDQLMISALSAATTIADGYGRYTAPEQRQLYRSAKRELLRVETQLAIARQADLISAQAHSDLSNRVQSVSRLLGGYLVYLERQLAPEATANGKP
jgi:four helix bundle protein